MLRMYRELGQRKTQELVMSHELGQRKMQELGMSHELGQRKMQEGKCLIILTSDVLLLFSGSKI